MNSWWIHPRYLAAHAVATLGDADLRDGVHLRLLPSRALGLALSPMLVWTLPPQPLDPLPGMAWFDRHGRPWTSGVLDDAGGEAIGWFNGNLPQGLRLLAVEAAFAAGDGEIALLDRIDQRLLGHRSRAPHIVAAPAITLVRLRGRGPVQLRGWVINEMHALEQAIGGAPLLRLSAPIDGDRAWYAGGEGVNRAMRRVEESAPTRWTPPDRPVGPWDPLPRSAEVQRLQALRPALDEELEQLLRDPGLPPQQVLRQETWQAGVLDSGRPRPWQQLELARLDNLLAQAMDPGVARYLGLMGRLRDAPGEPVLACLAAGLFAVIPEMATELAAPDAFEQRLISRIAHMDGGTAEVISHARRSGLTVRALLTAAAAVPQTDPLPPPQLELGVALWQREDDGPSWRFRQQIRVLAPPLVAMAAMSRLASGAELHESRHAFIDLADGAVPPQRARALLLGTSTSLASDRAGVLSDAGIPVAGAPWTYRISLADLFGRWGGAAEVAVDMPPRPSLPKPVLRMHFKAALAMPEGDAACSPGVLQVWVQAPASADLTAGSRPLASVQLVCNGAVLASPVPPGGGELSFSFDAPALTRAGSALLVVAAHFSDDQGQHGPSAEASTTVHDPRPPLAVSAGIGLLWTSRPGPATEVDCVLRLQGAAGLCWRVYLSDQRGLGIAEHVDGRPLTRAEVAVAGARLGLEGQGERGAFRLLTDQPIPAEADGTLRFQTLLPRALQTVQFLRFVPLDAQGREAPFGNCPLVPLAVPRDHRPPAPRVEVNVDPATGLVRARVHAVGLDRVALQAAEPGLFSQPPRPNARAPCVRLRRAMTAVAHPLYARVAAERDARLGADGADFVATFDAADLPAPLPPYTKVYFWAELRMPAERRLPVGLAELALPGGAVQTEPAEPGRSDAPGAWSEASAPAMAVHVPAAVPTLDAATVSAFIAASVVPGHWRAELSLSDGPRLHALAIGAFTVQLHLQQAGGDWELMQGALPLVDGGLSWSIERPGPVAPGLRLALELIDPMGRRAMPRVAEAVVQ